MIGFARKRIYGQSNAILSDRIGRANSPTPARPSPADLSLFDLQHPARWENSLDQPVANGSSSERPMTIAP